MEIRYAPRRFAEILGVAPRELEAAVARGLIARPVSAEGKAWFAPEALTGARIALGREPRRRRPRCQLFLNFKGGTGKTSISTSYAFRLAEMGYRVLVIDLDSQGHATKCMGLEGASFPRTLFDALIKKEDLSRAIVPTAMPGLQLVPSNLAMSTVDLSLMPMAAREFRLRNVLKDVDMHAGEGHAGRYDYVVLDAPPSFGLLNLNALMAADDLFIPVLADFLSFDGLKLLFETIVQLEEDLTLRLAHVFVLVNAYNQTFKIAREAKAALAKHYGEYLMKSVIRQCTKFAQASSEGCPIFAFDPESKGAQDIESVVREALAAVDQTVELPSARAGER